MKKVLLVVSKCLLGFTLISGSWSGTAWAESAETNDGSPKPVQFELPNNVSKLELPEGSFSTKGFARGKKIEVDRPEISILSNFNVTGDRISFSDSLTAADPADFWFFSVPTDRTILTQLRSANANYRVDLYSIDWNTGTATPTPFWGKAGEIKFATDLAAGDWGLRVTSTGSVGDSYSIHANMANPSVVPDPSNPANTAKLISYSENLISAVMEYPNGDITVNGEKIGNTSAVSNINAHLTWAREYTFTSGGAHSSINHDIDDVRIKSVTIPLKYTSQYAQSDNAVFITLDKGTLFTSFRSNFVSGVPTSSWSTFEDVQGRTTPRRLDEIDMLGDPDLLVYDLDKKKVIDFASSLNYWYAKGIESFPSVVYYK
ncbi:hypothetical protein [Paenibacillus sp. FSL K6-2393]|uniref:hypothetical protein n=1 Tax=Paenibacillus sp. FSL K6-2393 TaxID=2921475 RepID=UPI0030FA092D